MSSGTLLFSWTFSAILAGGLGMGVFPPATVGPADSTVRLPSGAVEEAAPRPLPFHYDLYTFRGDAGQTAVVAAFAVEAGDLENQRAGDNRLYRFSVTLVLADTKLRTVTNRHDTVAVELPRRLRGEHMLYTHLEVQAAPSDDIQHRVTMIDATELGIGQLYTAASPIPDYSGSELMMSDVALGQPGALTGWTRGEETLALLPTSRFPSRSFDVYYEIYNLPAGNRYATEVTVERLRKDSDERTQGGETLSRLRFTGVSAASEDGTLPELRSVGTSLDKGRYRITVAIEDLGSGDTTSGSRTFEIQDSGPGATMVPTYPVQPRKGWGR